MKSAAYMPEGLLAATFLEAFEKFSRDVLAGPNDYGYDLDDDKELRSVRERLLDLALEVHEIEIRHVAA